MCNTHIANWVDLCEIDVAKKADSQDVPHAVSMKRSHSWQEHSKTEHIYIVARSPSRLKG